MKFGLSFLPDITNNDFGAKNYYDNAIVLSKIADEAGFSKVKMTEHYLHPYGGYCPSPLMFLTLIAAHTEKIRLITGCILPAFMHPVKLAAQTSMLDAISNGRLDVGFARAYLPYEFESFGVSLDESRDRFKSTIEATIRLWTEENVSIDSPYFKIKNANNYPKPMQVGHPPVWGAATRSRESFSWIASKGFGLLVTNTITSREQLSDLIEIYRDSYEPSDQIQNRSSEVALSVPMYLDTSHKKAINKGVNYLNKYFKVWVDALKSWSNKNSTDYPGYTSMHKYFNYINPLDLVKTNSAIFGDPKALINSIYELKEWYGIDEILWQIDFGAMPLKDAQNSLELFIEYVMPEFQQKSECNTGTKLQTTF